MSATARGAQQAFFDRYLDVVRRATGDLPLTEHDPEWPSPCETGEVDAESMVRWRPIARAPEADFRALEESLGVALRDELKTWLGAWWCLPIEATWREDTVVLRGFANEAEFARFEAGLVRHVRAARAVTVPVAVFHDDRFVSVDNATGAVLIEDPGRAPSVAAQSLSAFLEALAPVPV